MKIMSTTPSQAPNDEAMKIIINAGKGRTDTYAALSAVAEGDFRRAGELLESADKSVSEAHVVHTDRIQQEASGESTAYSMLFTHAEDTLMTAYGELRLVRKMLPIFENYETRLRALEEREVAQP